jgi:hypothetical protein
MTAAYGIVMAMTKLLEQAIATVRELPEPDQDMAAQFLLGFANPDADRYQLTEAQAAEVELAQREVRAGEVATDTETTDVWLRRGASVF